jgi:uncharacterized protein (DUF1015 family)
MRLQALRALRPPPTEAARVAAPPYDTLSTAEARALAAPNPLSFLHVSRSEVDLPDGTDPYSDIVYESARAYFEKLRREGHLQPDPEPAIYLYEQHWRGRVQTGFVALCHIDDYERNIIKKHEKTRAAKENDRLRHNQTIGAQPGLVFLAYRDDPAVDQFLTPRDAAAPLYDFTDENGVRHRVRRVTGAAAAEISTAFARVPAAYIADGHHRAASAWRAGQFFREANPEHTGDENYNWFPACLFTASTLRILPYNRVVKDLHGLSPTEFLEKLRGVARVSPGAPPEPAHPGQISLYLEQQWHGLDFNLPAGGDPIARLDASVLQDRVLAPLLGIADPRTSDRIDFIGGIRGPGELVKRVDSGAFAAAFSMHPVTLGQLMEIADAGQIMPPKSTWFEPKLRSGLLIHLY